MKGYQFSLQKYVNGEHWGRVILVIKATWNVYEIEHPWYKLGGVLLDWILGLSSPLSSALYYDTELKISL